MEEALSVGSLCLASIASLASDLQSTSLHALQINSWPIGSILLGDCSLMNILFLHSLGLSSSHLLSLTSERAYPVLFQYSECIG